jgi:hypothetical protein
MTNTQDVKQDVPRRWAVYFISDAFGNTDMRGWLAAYDLTANDGHGDFMTVPDVGMAMLFDSPNAVFAAYNGIPTNHPIRIDDGQPNRPMTAFTVQIQEVPATIVMQQLTQQKGH